MSFQRLSRSGPQKEGYKHTTFARPKQVCQICPFPSPCFFNLVDPRGRRGTFPVISSPPPRKFCSGGVTLLFVFPRFLIPSQAKSKPPPPPMLLSLGARHKNPVPLPEKVWKSEEKIWLLFSTKKGFRATSSANSWSPKVSIL